MNITTDFIKDTLVNKFEDEGCYFTKKDIKVNNKTITIEGYEFNQFKIKLEEDDYFGYVVYIYENDEIIIFEDSRYDYPIKSALIQLGYRIANTY